MNQIYLNHSYLISAVNRFQGLFFDYSSYFDFLCQSLLYYIKLTQ